MTLNRSGMALSRSSKPRSHCALTPRGKLPATTTASWPAAICSRRASKACCACSSTQGPTPLRSVMRPLVSASLMLLRVSPGTRIKASTKPRRANNASNGCRLSSPRKPLTVRLCPRSANTWATFKPLPAAWLCKTSLRLTSPRRTAGSSTVRSSAGFRVIVRMFAINGSPPGPAPVRRSPVSALAAPRPGRFPGSFRAPRP
ncbi:hypothetical protein D3C81_1552930 [compost metagenome]